MKEDVKPCVSYCDLVWGTRFDEVPRGWGVAAIDVKVKDEAIPATGRGDP
jgi:hypothetical protein